MGMLFSFERACTIGSFVFGPSASDAPRGFEFLYSLNRLNVATSRAQALVILVASPELLTAQARSDRQLRLVNALCSYLELVEAAPETLAGTPRN